MTTFAAFCENPTCGAIFPAPGIIGGAGNATIHMTNTRYGPCPSCGGPGRIPDGVYNYAQEVVQFLRGPRESIAALRKIEALLKLQNGQQTSSSEQLIAEIRALSPRVADAVSKTPDVSALQQWIQIVLALVTLAILVQTTYFKKSDKELEAAFNERLLQHQTERIPPPKSQGGTAPHRRAEPKVGRNTPCVCGSGRKYKKCCGAGA
jgi:uncharacterized protein YecA (UPF0149 family)